MDWNGKAAIVTGGASGIGAATDRELARQGATVAIMDINADAGTALGSALRAEGLKVEFFLLDVSDAAACRAQVDAFHGSKKARPGRASRV